MLVERIWTKAKEISNEVPIRYFWDLGDTQWELFNSELRYFRILKRELNGSSLKETVELLEELPVSTDLLSHYSTSGWIVSEKPLHSSYVSEQKGDNRKEKKSQQQHLLELKPSVKKSPHEKLKQSDQESLVTTLSQSSYTPPIDPSTWSSLSQWIPQSALFQPSLHHLADLELSEQPIQPSPSQTNRSYYSRPSPTQYQQARHIQKSTYVPQQYPSYRKNHSQYSRVPSVSK